MRLAALVLALLLLAGCGTDDAEPGSAAATSPAPAPTPTATEPPWETIEGPLARCGPQPIAVGDAELRYRVVRDPAVGRLPTVAAGSGRTVAVLLHQTDGNGLCGWLEHLSTLTEVPGVAVLAIDVCPYGAAVCREDVQPTAVVAAAVAHARRAMHAERVVVVGASMGGSVALMSAAALPGVAAAVDLSGPRDWPGMEAIRGGRAVRVPVLVAMADDEGLDEVRAARRVVAHAPEGSRFLSADTGHGYDLVEPFAGEIRAWVAGG